MDGMKRLRRNWVWGLFFAIVAFEWHQPRRMALMLGDAALSAVIFSLFDAANERWTWATLAQWLRRRRRHSGPA